MTPEKFEALVNLGTYNSARGMSALKPCLIADLEALGGVSELPKSVRATLLGIATKLTPVNPMGMRAYFHHLGQNYKELAAFTLLAYDAGRCQGTQED